MPSDALLNEIIDKLLEAGEGNIKIAETIAEGAKNAASKKNFIDTHIDYIKEKNPKLFQKYHLERANPPKNLSNKGLEDPKFAKFFEYRYSVLVALNECGSELLNDARKFSDLIINGPSNEAEAVVLNAAKTLLEPNEFCEAVQSEISISDTVKKIDGSVLKKLNVKMFIIYHMQLLADKLLPKEFNLDKVLGVDLTKNILLLEVDGSGFLEKLVSSRVIPEHKGSGGPDFK